MRWSATAILLVCLSLSAGSGADEKPLAGCYVSTGDNDWLWQSPPVQSKASIGAVFDSLEKAHGVDRIYWRGFQSEYIADHYLSRPDSFQLHDFWMWEKHLTKDVGTSRLAVEAAHDRGMTIWGFTALFDHGAQAASDSAKGMGPSPIEHRLRAEHPEYAPTDRYAIRRQAGPMEFAFAEVRKTLADTFAEQVEKCNYDGLMFYTYVEHLNIWFQDEYGFSQPIVDEFKRRYGQDIRTETFDRYAWYRLRGEYVTQFLRELKARLRASGKRLGMAIDPQNTHYPAPWLCVKPRDFLTTGRMYMDWERWVCEGIVDEIMVYCNGATEAALNGVLAVTKGTNCAVSTIRGPAFLPQHEHFAREGVRNVMSGAYDEIERGYKDKQELSALNGNDALAKLRALQQIAKDETEAPLADVIAAAGDPNLLVRRQAIRALAERKDPAVVPALEAALDDEEHGVWCLAAEALAKVNGPESVGKMFQAIRRHGNFQFCGAAVAGLSSMGQDRTADIAKGLADQDVSIRQVAAHSLGRGERRDGVAPMLVKALNDPDAQVRFFAARGLMRCSHEPGVIDALTKGLSDEHPTVRASCVVALQSSVRSHSRWLGPMHRRVLNLLTAQFGKFGDKYQGPDAEWGFRPVGNALMALGPRGREALDGYLRQGENKKLADFAWRVLHVPLTGYTCCAASEAEALKAYQEHPNLAKDQPPIKKIAEPAAMPYIQQNFDSFAPSSNGTLGDVLHESGEWRTFGAVHPPPVVQDKVKHGNRGNAIRLCRCKAGAAHGLDGLRADYRLTGEKATVELWAYREGSQASFCVLWKDSATSRMHVGIFVKPGGQVAVISGDGKWADTKAQMPADSWQRVRFHIDPEKGGCSVGMGAESEVLVAEGIAIPRDGVYNLLSISPQAPEGGVVYVDDVSVTVPNSVRE